MRGLMRTARVAVADVDGEVVACQFFEPKGDYLYLFRLAVLPTYRQHGIGGALIAYAEEQARAMGLPRTQFSVRLALPRQRAYYERMGYHVRRVRHPRRIQRTNLRDTGERPDAITPIGSAGFPACRRCDAGWKARATVSLPLPPWGRGWGVRAPPLHQPPGEGALLRPDRAEGEERDAVDRAADRRARPCPQPHPPPDAPGDEREERRRDHRLPREPQQRQWAERSRESRARRARRARSPKGPRSPPTPDTNSAG